MAAAAVLSLPGASGSAFAAVLPVLAPGAHVCGGISSEERQEMQATQDLYNLRLSFAEVRSGAYVAGVTVTIESADRAASYGPFTDCGPLLQVALSPGVYRVTANYAGITQQKTVRIGKGATQAALYWPEDAPGDEPPLGAPPIRYPFLPRSNS